MKYFLQFKSIQHFNFYNFLSLISTFYSCFVSISMLCFFECDVLLKGSIFKQPIGAFREYIAGVLSGPKYRLTTLISAVWSMFWRFYQRRKLCGSTWGGKSHFYLTISSLIVILKSSFLVYFSFPTFRLFEAWLNGGLLGLYLDRGRGFSTYTRVFLWYHH